MGIHIPENIILILFSQYIGVCGIQEKIPQYQSYCYNGNSCTWKDSLCVETLFQLHYDFMMEIWNIDREVHNVSQQATSNFRVLLNHMVVLNRIKPNVVPVSSGGAMWAQRCSPNLVNIGSGNGLVPTLAPSHDQGWRLLNAPFINFSISKISDLAKVTVSIFEFIFDRCHHGWAVATPDKYKRWHSIDKLCFDNAEKLKK